MLEVSPFYVPIAPVVVPDVFDDIPAIIDQIARTGPFPSVSGGPVERISAAQSEVFANRSKDAEKDGHQPIYRVNFDEGSYAGSPVSTLLNCEKFRSAASAAFGGAYIGDPLEGAINVLPPVGGALAAHTDIPFFVGMEEAPRWLRLLMIRSGLFEAWRWPLATGLFWLHQGDGGAFEYWDQGPERPPQRLSGLNNRCLISDNERMFHRVVPVANHAPIDLSLEQIQNSVVTRDSRNPDEWSISINGEPLHVFPTEQMRFTILLKAPVFADAAAAASFSSPDHRLDFDAVMEIFLCDLMEKDLIHDIDELSKSGNDHFIRLLSQTYPTPNIIYNA